MKILLLGAAGFIGRHIYADLTMAGHTVVAVVRKRNALSHRLPGAIAVEADLNQMTNRAGWQAILDQYGPFDTVVNCAGILQSTAHQSAAAIHHTAPVALFDACQAEDCKPKVIQISAISADKAASTEYALTKLAADDHLRSLDLDWVVLRPSLVYAQGSYGGTSTLRGLAGVPFVTPLIGKGEQLFQPIHADDLARTVRVCIEAPSIARVTLTPTGPDIMTMARFLNLTRAWLDFAPSRPLLVPKALVLLAARLGDGIGTGPIRTTALKQLEYGNITTDNGFPAAIGFQPRSVAEAFLGAPSHVQDRWHARLYFVRPVITLSLALLWLGSGLAGFINGGAEETRIATALDLPKSLVVFIGAVFSVFDLGIGGVIASGRGGWRIGALQLLIVGGYTLILGTLAPGLWLDPFGALLKNLPIIALILAWMSMLEDR